jgi:beta-mannosidase
MNVNGVWKLQMFAPSEGSSFQAERVDFDDTDWLQADVPGDVHTALLMLGMIPDPFIERNVEQVQWVAEKEWWFRKRFQVDLITDSSTRWLLTFEGLDLFATIYLNGQLVGEHANMFRPAGFDVTGMLSTDRENLLAVRFDPVRSRITDEVLPIQMPEYDSHARVQVRKTQAQFMWDHTPPCLMVGIWQGVRLDHYTGARLLAPHFRVLSLDADQAVVSINIQVEQWVNSDFSVRISLQRQSKNSDSSSEEDATTHAVEVPVQKERARAVLIINKPSRWFPNGYGDPALYHLHIDLLNGEHVIDTFDDQVGLRTVRVDRTPDPDEPGCENFTCVVNDVPIFAKGANWVPTDLFNGRAKASDYEAWLSLLKEANGNMLRVWGGGQYEPDAFYKAADRLGILIWHDFMFAGASYPEHKPEFYEEVRKEAEFQVTRLRNRPCMALWCGNNELDWHLDEMQWDQPGAYYPGKHIMHKLLPEIVQRFDPDRFYWPSSPYGGNDHNGSQAGDKHNWRTWHAIIDRHFGERPTTIVQFEDRAQAISYWHLGTDMGRFISEFGIHASPVRETLRRNIPEAGLSYNSEEMRFRNRNIIQDRGDLMMTAHTGLPGSLDEYIDYSMMVQAEGLKYGIEHYRRRKFHCSGTLFWQWNDNCPSITWSVLDYYRFPKAGYFFVKRAFAPVILSVQKQPNGAYAIWGVNDTLTAVSDTLTWSYLTFEGSIRAQDILAFVIPPNTSSFLVELDPALFKAVAANEMLWLHSNEGAFPDNRWFFAPELRDLDRRRPDLNVEWEETDSYLRAHLRSASHAYFVNLFVANQNVRYSDNWIDIFPDEERCIELFSLTGERLSPRQVEVKWR